MRISDWSSDVCSSDLLASQEVRSLLTARKLLLGKLIDVELGIRGILRGFGLKIGTVTRKMFDHRVRELVAEQETLTTIADAMLAARALLINEVAKLHKALRSEEHTSELQSLMRISYAVFCLKKKRNENNNNQHRELRLRIKQQT